MTEADKARYLAKHYLEEANQARSSGFGGPEYLEGKEFHARAFEVYAKYLESGALYGLDALK
jgi:hypothetical protein